MTGTRFILLGVDGAPLADSDAEAVAALDPATGLMWDRTEAVKRMNWRDAQAYCARSRIGGFDDWRLPTRTELLTLVDDTRHDPAIDVQAFPNCKSSWYWTSTPLAASPSDCAWYVFFSDGNSYWNHQNDECFVRPVRASQ